MTDYLEFRGVVRKGEGLFSKQLEILGSAEIKAPPTDWPERIEPGTLNVRIVSFPPEFTQRFGANDLRLLDERLFTPEVELPHHVIRNNTLPPTTALPDRGNAQVWRATLESEKNGKKRQCWVLRRIGSGMSGDLECVAGEHLRSTMGLSNDDSVVVTVEGVWERDL